MNCAICGHELPCPVHKVGLSVKSEPMTEPKKVGAMELLPCPFCGAEAKVVRNENEQEGVKVRCRACGAQTGLRATYQTAFELWQSRFAPINKGKEGISEREKALEQACGKLFQAALHFVNNNNFPNEVKLALDNLNLPLNHWFEPSPDSV